MVDKMVVRVDDVNPNTDFTDFYAQLEILEDFFDEIILGINLIGKASDNGSIYPELPLRGHDKKYFYNVDRIMSTDVLDSLSSFSKVRLVSHGLIHGIHSQMSRDAVEMSILTSCSFLGTKQFIPPFNEVSETVREVCEANGIEIIGNHNDRSWHSLESERFNPLYQTWYYHPWRMSAEELSKAMGIPV